MPRFKKSIFLLCVIFCIAGEKRKELTVDVETNTLENSSAVYNKAFLNFIGTNPLKEIVIQEGESYVRFRRTLPSGQDQIVIEVTDIGDSHPFVKYSRVHINTLCNPAFSTSYDEHTCFELVHHHQKTIYQVDLFILMQLLTEHEFWELSPNESHIRGLKSESNAGEIWQIEAKTTYSDLVSNSTKVISHSASRNLDNSFQSIHAIGQHMLDLVENRFVFP